MDGHLGLVFLLCGIPLLAILVSKYWMNTGTAAGSQLKRSFFFLALGAGLKNSRGSSLS